MHVSLTFFPKALEANQSHFVIILKDRLNDIDVTILIKVQLPQKLCIDFRHFKVNYRSVLLFKLTENL